MFRGLVFCAGAVAWEEGDDMDEGVLILTCFPFFLLINLFFSQGFVSSASDLYSTIDQVL